MIVRRNQAPADPESEARAAHYGPPERLRYSDAGGLTQFGAHVETLQPGSRSSDRHWHYEEDGFLYVVSGEATAIEDDGTHKLGPGDAACWPAGAANAHHVVNRSAAPRTYLILGTRRAREVIHYPDVGRVGYIEGETWRLHRADDGALIMDGKTEQARPLTWWGPRPTERHSTVTAPRFFSQAPLDVKAVCSKDLTRARRRTKPSRTPTLQAKI